MERSARRLLRASKNAKRKIRPLLSFHAFPPSRDVSTVAEENFRVFWKGVEAKARVGEKRGGCASYLALEAGLVGEALEADLVERIGRVAASRKGAWRSAGASTREIRRAIAAGKSRVNGAPAVDFAATKPTRRARAIETTRARNAPDELAEEDLLVRVEGLCREKGWRGQIRSRRRAKPSAAGAPKVGAGSSLACRDSARRKRRACGPSRGDAR